MGNGMVLVDPNSCLATSTSTWTMVISGKPYFSQLRGGRKLHLSKHVGIEGFST